MLKRIAIAFGALFLLVGILGFVPGVTTGMEDGGAGRLFGVFAVDTMHNMVHMLTGIVAIACGLASEAASRNYFRVFGILYALVAAMGFYYGREPLMGMMAHNMPDAVLHTAIAIVALLLGFGHVAARFEHRDTGTHHPA
ncbi:MAG TPA: DUF4383 domain-containing protein [Rhodocyclaceae bacterium]|nr:DUF4383 domain-containing protein [Rhodocyclaceae bacterium]